MYQHGIANPESKVLYELNNNYGYGNASYQQPLNEKWSLKSGLSYSYNDNALKLDGVPMGETEKGLHSKVVLENSISDKVEIRFGGESINRKYEASRLDLATNEEQSQGFNENISAAFAEGELYTSNKFVTRAGTRLEHNSLTNTLSVDPRLSIAYKPGGQGQFSFAYGRFRQSAKNQYVRVNNDLNSEKAQHFILNYQIINNDRTFRVETYYKKYTDLVKFVDRNPYLLTSTGTGYAKGVELFWRDSRSVKYLDYWVSYSFLDTKRDYLNFPSSAMPTFASKHNFSVVGKYFMTAIKSQIGVTYSYGSPRSYNNPNTDQFNGGRTPSYQDLSANVSYLPKNWLIIYVSCTNLLGRDNIFGYEYSVTPDANGVYASRAVMQPAKHFLLAGVFITISKNKSVNQLPNL